MCRGKSSTEFQQELSQRVSVQMELGMSKGLGNAATTVL